VDHVEKHEQEVKTILIVEENEAIGEFLTEVLKAFTPYQPLLATDGMQALEMVKTLVPDLFLLDYFLPKMNGLELYIHFQEKEKLWGTPVLLMSASNLGSASHPVHEIEEHRIYFIKKPFELDALLQMVKTLLAA
jgi:CheY-like chemotaxis protein